MAVQHPVPPNERTYRRIGGIGHLTSFQVMVKETDLHVQAARDLSGLCRDTVIQERAYLEAFIQAHPAFLTTLTPWRAQTPAPALVATMIDASRQAGVGPMAAVAGALADCVGRELLTVSDEVIVENGGDVFLAIRRAVTVGVDAGRSPLSRKVGLRVDAGDRPLAVCTSSGTVGHSLSYGHADAVCVVAHQGALADAAATAVANRISSPIGLKPAIEFARRIEGLVGVLCICGDQMGAWGDVEIVPLHPQRGESIPVTGG